MAGSEHATRLLGAADSFQREAITSAGAPLLVIAGAGSGKTRVLTHRIAWRIAEGDAAAPHVLALTFTRKAAGELRDRLSRLGLPAPITAGTFHAVALAQLRRRALDRGEALPAVLDSKARLLGRLLPSGTQRRSPTGRAGRAGRPLSDRDVVAAVASEIEWSKARLVTPENYPRAAAAAGRVTALSADQVSTAFAAYEAEKKRRAVLDFDDLLIRLTQTISRDVDFAAAQRWQFRHFFVDELQDANAAQLALLDAWLGGRPDLFAVGDPRQAIYAWNGADPDAVTTFTERYRGATVLRLDANYRSTPQLIGFSAAALALPGGPPKQANSFDGAAALALPGGPPKQANSFDGAADLGRPDGALPTITAYPSDEAEAVGVAQALRKGQGPDRRWARCAVLARTNAQLVLFESELRAAHIPCRSGAGNAFLARPAVRSALDALPSTGSRHVLVAWLEDLDAEGAEADAEPTEPTGSRDDAERSAERQVELATLARLGRDYLALDSAASPDGLLAFLRSSLRSDPAPGGANAVELATFHRSKGLEWPVVFVTGLEAGLVPIAHASTVEDIEEERRLLYVALSRAEDELHCSWAQVRTFGTRSVEREPSPFLAPLEEARLRLEAGAQVQPATIRSVLAASRATLANSPQKLGRTHG